MKRGSWFLKQQMSWPKVQHLPPFPGCGSETSEPEQQGTAGAPHGSLDDWIQFIPFWKHWLNRWMHIFWELGTLNILEAGGGFGSQCCGRSIGGSFPFYRGDICTVTETNQLSKQELELFQDHFLQHLISFNLQLISNSTAGSAVAVLRLSQVSKAPAKCSPECPSARGFEFGDSASAAKVT